MSESPLSKKQKQLPIEDFELSKSEDFPDITGISRSRTPRKLFSGSSDKPQAYSQQWVSSSSGVPNLKPLNDEGNTRGRVYSQSPPRSPTRSPTRRLQLIQLSPSKKSRLEKLRIHEAERNGASFERLCINRLVLHNFKSYAGTQVVGPFHSSFSAVVGPNGSGKSNVIDSMLFVFGFRANKMRQGNLSSLIHKSEAHRDLESCSVDIYFDHVIDNPDHTTSINDDKPPLVITRRAFKNNTSKYYINGKDSNYKQVTQLLRDKGVDLDHKRFLILQGEVESIAQMKPKAERESEDGLLEYLEDIIGTAKYKAQIEDSLLQIDSLNEVCREKENRFQLVEREKDSLEDGKNEALEYLDKEKTHTLLNSKLFQYKIWEINNKLFNYAEKTEALKQTLSAEIEEHAKHQRQVKEAETRCAILKDKKLQNQKHQKELSQTKRDKEREKISLEAKLRNFANKKAKAEKSSGPAQAGIADTRRKIEDLELSQQGCEKEIAELNASLVVEKKKLTEIKLGLKDKTSDFAEQITKLEAELEPWKLKLQEKKTQIQLAKNALVVYEESKKKAAADVERLRQTQKFSTDKLSEHLQGISSLESEQLSLQKKIASGQTALDGAGERMHEMKAILTSHRQRFNEAKSSLNNFQNKNKVLTALMRLHKSGRIEGFHGRLGDLGTIDDAYDVAISTACPRLDDIVVDTVECGQQCIEHLRKNRLGYARFILLDKLRNFDMRKPDTPEDVPRIFDLVKSKDLKFLPAFYSVLRDTLVANDLKQANRVAYGKRRYRVVTLDGKLIDISGAMSGGGTFKASGLMKSKHQGNEFLVSPEEVQKLETDLVEREKNFKIASETFREMGEAMQDLKERVPNIELEISKKKMEAETLESDIKSADHRLAKLLLTEEKELHGSSVKELQDEKDKIDKLNGLCREIEEQMLSKSEMKASLQDRIMEIGGSKLQMQNSLVDSVSQKLSINLAKQKRGKTALKKTESDIKRLERQFEEAILEIETCQREMVSIQVSLSAVEDNLIGVQKTLDDLVGFDEEYSHELETLELSLNEELGKVSNFHSKEIELKAQLESLNEVCNRLIAEKSRFENKLNSLKIRDMTSVLKSLQAESLQAESQETGSAKSCEEISADRTSAEEYDSATAIDHEIDVDAPELNESDANVSVTDKVEKESLVNGLTRHSEDELRHVNIEDVEREMIELQEYLDSAHVDIEILEDYVQRLAEFRMRRLDLNEAVKRRDEMRTFCELSKKKRLDEFMEGFNMISMNLKEMYQMITMGGNAELELVDSLDPFSEGVLFSVMPPKKSWRNISNLSGGEKTLSSLALVFALHKYRPTPLYVMDEIDAALDFRNVSIVANYIKERTKNAQFVVISLRNNMFELAQSLVGIYKSKNMTRSVTIQNKGFINADD
ncbi:LAMI_0H15500g1_1 [Lachancea mirantina]|uniref:Structural maintenance of chromosomes protein n=1 Tax=Lachancea mirantina TaxID=1230905 RepID=A0A1G4KIH2_9SACH|nr:LAMI_0H15500g1_1 [Lachancea mirantina]